MDVVLELQSLPLEALDDSIDEEEGLRSTISIWTCGSFGRSTISVALCLQTTVA